MGYFVKGNRAANVYRASVKLERVGLVPAAGQGKRISPMPCSKEIIPVGFRQIVSPGDLRPKVVSHYLFEKYRRAGVVNTFVVLRDGKWDIPAYYGDGAMLGLHLAYIVISQSEGPPDTIDRAYSFVKNSQVAFGFPDILFGPKDVYERLFGRLEETRADIVLGLYRAHSCRAMDMVRFGKDGRVHELLLKPARTRLKYAWICAVWGPTFSKFMHVRLRACRAGEGFASGDRRTIDPQGDLPMGAVLCEAVRAGLHVNSVAFPKDSYVDIGTPTDLYATVRRMSMMIDAPMETKDEIR